MPYKRILTIQDISCIGQCSMTVAHPILSACGHEVCMLPAAVLSTHTGGFGKPAVCKLSSVMQDMVSHWKENGITFDLIYTGYLGSVEAVSVAADVMDTMLAPGGWVVVDPAMADHGRLYSGLDDAYAGAMQELCKKADIILPNITEAAMMTGLPYRDVPDREYVSALLAGAGEKDLVLTGVGFDPGTTGAAVRSGGEIRYCLHDKLGGSFHGTGDIFASAFCGALACGNSIFEATEIAGRFTCLCIRETMDNPAHWYGVKFEPVLGELITMVHKKSDG